jgi:transglutaminase-like putative cysteine protease
MGNHYQNGARMNRHTIKALKIVLCLAFASDVCPPAWAQRSYEPPVAVERVVRTYVVRADGSNVQTAESVLRIETPQGIEGGGSRQISYISSQEDIDSIEAWTIQPDGTRIPVLPDSIRTQDEGNDGGVAEFSDTKYKVIIFPKVQVGSRVYYKAQSSTHTAAYPGEFQASFVFSPTARYEHWEARIAVPSDRKLYIEQRGVSGGLTETVDGIAHYAFYYRRDSFMPPEEGRAGSSDYADFLSVSTMPDMVTLGAAYQKGASGKSQVTEDIRALALKLTAGKMDERAKVKALHQWVASNIRYVAVMLGNGRLVPHSAHEVLSNLYGDCKDHVTLLEALLAAVGIESSPALIGAGNTYKFFSIGVHTPINHVITYIPSLDMYLDSTARFAPFGTLPSEIMDKPVVITSLAQLGRTPRMKAEAHATRVSVSMTIRPDGSIDGESSSTMSGTSEVKSRSNRFYTKSTPEEEVVNVLLFRFNETGSGSIDHPAPEDLDEPYWVRSTFRLDPVSNFPGHGALAVPVGLAPGEIAWIGSDKPLVKRQFPYYCESRLVEEVYTIHFPSNVVLGDIPRGTTYQDGIVFYQSRFQRADRTVSVRRRLLVQRQSQVCDSQDHEKWRAFYKVVQRDLRSQIFYR